MSILGKSYFARQAATLLKMARTTTDPELSAKLVGKAADLKSKADPLPELGSSRPPDVEIGGRGDTG
jgi:hypothetical protein